MIASVLSELGLRAPADPHHVAGSRWGTGPKVPSRSVHPDLSGGDAARAERHGGSGTQALLPPVRAGDPRPVTTSTPSYPGHPAIADGSEAIAHVETRISEAACAYPITPSTTMAALYQAAVADGRTDLWGTPLAFVEPESEHSSASAAEG